MSYILKVHHVKVFVYYKKLNLKNTHTTSMFLDESSRNRLVESTLRISIPIVLIIALTGIWTNLYVTFHLLRFILNVVGLIIILIAWLFARRGRVVLAINCILYSFLVIFAIATLLNGGVKTPNYVGFLGISVMASIFSTNRFIWGTYFTFAIIGALTLIYPLYDISMVTFPSEHRYYTLYAVIGLLISFCLVFTREAFGRVIKELAERESLLSSAFEAITDPLLLFNEAGEMTYLNSSAKSLHESVVLAHACPLDELPMFEMSAKADCSLRSLLKERSFKNGTKVYKTHTTLDREALWYSVSLSPYSSEALGAGALVVLRDVTEQQRLTQHQKMQAIGRLANGIAHDFNNMLGAIKSANDLLMLDVDEEHHDLLEMIEEATDRSANMIKQLRLFSKRNDSEPSIINLNELLHDVRLMLQSVSQHSHLIRVEMDEQVVLFKGVREQLHSMLMNLGLNALQAMKEQGVLTFHMRLKSQDSQDSQELPLVDPSSDQSSSDLLLLEPVEPPVEPPVELPVELPVEPLALQVSPSSTALKRCVVIEVSDQGDGISPDLQERIFEPFFTTRKQGEGVGLGLSIVHGAVQRHQGEIKVMSQVGKGTTMRVTLPCDDTQILSTTSTPQPTTHTSFEGLSVLIIDDEALIRQSLSAMCKSLGLTVSVAEGGAQGLELVRGRVEQLSRDAEGASAARGYDLIILDMLMPGKDGREVFLELQALAPQIPVILSSGYYPEDALAEMNQKGLAGQLHKPYGLKQVSALLSQVLGAS